MKCTAVLIRFGYQTQEPNPILMFLFQIVHRYDIILIQEVRDRHLSATKKLMEHVNK